MSRRRPKPVHDPSSSAVLITGGARGIGRATADYLISQGYTVVVTVRKQAQCDEMKDAAEKSDNRSPYPILFDVTNEEQVGPAMEQLKSFLERNGKQLIAVVNNAGINPEGDIKTEAIDERPTELADSAIGSRVFETNVIGVGRVTKACMPLLADNGRILNIGSYFGSIAGQIGLDHCYYETSKFALEGMTANMRRTLKKEGIKVVLIKPGNIATDMNSSHGEVSAKVVAIDIEHAIASSNPSPRYYPGTVMGKSCKVACLIFEYLPTWLADKL